jgi:hypothetical protein
MIATAATVPRASVIVGDAGNGPGDSPVESVRNLAEIRANAESSKASLRVSRLVSYGSGAPPGTITPSWFSNVSLTAETPLSKNKALTDLATLDGLANSTTLTLKGTWFRAQRRFPADQEIAGFQTAIKEKLRAQNPTKNPPKFCEEQGADQKDCLILSSATVEKYIPEALEAFQDTFWGEGASWLFGGSATIGQESFEYFGTTTDMSTTKDNEHPMALGAHVAMVLPGNGGLVTLGYRLEESYKAQDPLTRCPPDGSEPFVECKAAAAGQPKETDASVAFVEYRRRFGLLAVAPRISRDFDADVTGIDVPVFLWTSDKGGLNGGLRAGWRDDTNDTVVGVFVGATFKLFE